MKSTPGTPTHVTSRDEAHHLAQRLRDPQRRFPFVVITTHDAGRSGFDADSIAATLGFKADIWVVDDRWTWDLNQHLGSAKVFGDAAAVYPPLDGKPLRHHLLASKDGAGDLDVVRAARECAPGRAARRTSAPRPATSAGCTRPTTGLHRADTADKVDALAHHLLDPTRDRPVAVITIPSNRAEPWIDPQEIIGAVGPAAEVHLLETGPRTFQLTAHLTRMAGVYGGAGRVYDVGQEWLADPYSSPLRFAYDAGEGSRATNDLIGDLAGALARTGHLTTETTVGTRSVTGKVVGTIPPSRAMVQLDDGSMGTIWAELVSPGVEIDAMVTKGMKVAGAYDPQTKRIDISSMVRDETTARSDLAAGAVILANVSSVTSDAATLVPYPGATARIVAEEITGNDLDDLTELLTPGETVAARYLGTGDGQALWSLSMVDVDDDETISPLSLIAGGPAWLSMDDETGTEPGATTQPAERPEDKDERKEQERLRERLRAAEERLQQQTRANSKADALERRVAELEMSLRSKDVELDDLGRQLRDAFGEIGALRNNLEKERKDKRRAVQKSNKGKSAARREVMGFADAEHQLRWDIHKTWVETTRPEDKPEWPLPEYGIGTDFCESVESLEGVSRERVLQVAVRVLSGRKVQDDHPLRTTKSGNSPAVTRVVDGVEWVCRRAPLQQSSPSARRLSYWRSSSGRIELSRVALHDDLTP